MARYTGPKCRLCRREGTKLFLKGTRCETARCSVAKREYPPGMLSTRRKKQSEYGARLREKQKLKRYYGILERQFSRLFGMAERMKGNTGENLLIILERRLDSIVQRLGFASSKAQARQFITHGLITVNAKKVDIPSYLCKVGDVISIKKKDIAEKLFEFIREQTRSNKLPSWLEVAEKPLAGRVRALPTREEVPIEINEQYVVEFCSR